MFNLSKKLHKVEGIFSGFIKTVELCSKTVEVLYTLPTTSDVNNSQQRTLHFLFCQENCTIALKPHISFLNLKFIMLLFTTCLASPSSH